MKSLNHRDLLNFLFNLFSTPGNWQQGSSEKSLFVLKPLRTILHHRMLNFFLKLLFFSPLSLSVVFSSALLSSAAACVVPTFSSASRCVFGGSLIKRCFISPNQCAQTELNWGPGAPMNHLQCPTGVSSYIHVLLFDNPLQKKKNEAGEM